MWIWIAHLRVFIGGCVFCVGPVHCLRDLQVHFFSKNNLKLGLTALFTHLKIILLHCFQFLVISSPTPHKSPQHIDVVVKGDVTLVILYCWVIWHNTCYLGLENRFVLPLEAKSKKYKENHLSVYLLGSKSKSMK